MESEVTSLKDIIFVTDRGANVKHALKDYTRLNCSNHLLNIVVEAAFKNVDSLQTLLQ